MNSVVDCLATRSSAFNKIDLGITLKTDIANISRNPFDKAESNWVYLRKFQLKLSIFWALKSESKISVPS